MTKREFFETVANAETLTDEIREFAAECISKMDDANAKRVEKNAEKAAEKEAERGPIRDTIVGVMTSQPKTATTLIAEAGVDIKPQAIPSLLKKLVEDGTILKTDVKVTGKGTQKGYSIA